MKKHTLWLLELVLWVAIIFSTLFIGFYAYSVHVKKHYTYYVFFKDVDGLIKGSPVKMMGYQVGYVSNISVVNDDVFITFIITDKKMQMPDSLNATVEFTGMGGSKSLELAPAGKVDGKNIINVIEPKRVQDFYDYQNQIARNIVTMSADFMQIMTDGRIKALKAFIMNPEEIKEADKVLNQINTEQTKLIKRLDK